MKNKQRRFSITKASNDKYKKEVELKTLDDLLKLVIKHREIIISEYKGVFELLIYDGYIH